MNLDERAGASRLPEADGAGTEVDVVGEVVPGVRDELRRPLCVAAHIPAEEVVRSALFPRNQTILDLGEVTLMHLLAFSHMTRAISNPPRRTRSGARSRD